MDKKPAQGLKKPHELENQLRQQLLETHSVKKQNRGNPETDDWLITYADAITLILVFFVLLLAVSDINQQKFESVAQSLNDKMLHKKQEDIVNPLKDLEQSLSQVLARSGINPKKAIKVNENSLKIELPGELLFGTASTDIDDTSARLIADVADSINNFSLSNYHVEIEGHTDDEPIHTNRFPSNWELSSGRAIAVLKIFFERGVPQDKLKAIGYAETQPKLPNRDAAGNPIKENQKVNRRVEIKLSKIYGFNGTDTLQIKP